jgi:outer membrane receptor for ferrienterochelin and colicin
LKRLFSTLLGFALLGAPFAAAADVAAPEAPAGATATITGTLVGQDSGLPVQNASVQLERDTTVVASTTSLSDGSYSFPSTAPGLYSIVVRATGYEPTRITQVEAVSGTTTAIRTPLLRARVGSEQGGLREIGSVTTGIGGQTLAASSTIQYNLSPDQLEAQGFLKAADALGQLPGIDISGGPHTVGDDTSIDIRGMGPGEVRQLLDGHPVGPIGVNGNDYFDYANAPYFLLQNIQTTLGSGASGLYGVDVIGGTIDFQTLNPTSQPHADFTQTIGTQGTLISAFKATGSYGNLGYAVGHVVTGTYGDFSPQDIFQSARPNNNLNLPNGGACTGSNDLTTCNTLLNTYLVGGNYRVQNDLVKLRYAFNPVTSLTLTGYDANQLSNSTGNGDDDDLPYDTRLAEIQAHTPTCGTSGYSVITNTGTACYTAQQYAAASSGPYGGGADRNRGTTLQDFHARFNTTVLGNNSITLDAFRDYYDFRKNSTEAAGVDPTGQFYVGGGTYEDEYLTTGFLASDDIVSRNNDLGFGYFLEHQRIYGNNFSPPQFTQDPTTGVFVLTAPGSFVNQPELGEGDFSFFLRDQFTLNNTFSLFANAWQRYSSVTQKGTLDPRLSLVFRPTPQDVFRITGGRANGDPSAVVKLGGLGSFNNPSSLNPSCTFPNSIASSGNPAVSPESANDYEVAYGHRFWDDTAVNVSGYIANERERLFSGVEPISAFPGAVTNPIIAAELAAYAAKIGSVCGATLTPATVLPYLGVSTTFNAASALYRGVEFTGRLRATPQFYADFVYDIQRSVLFGVPDSILAQNPTLINGAQIYAIPVHKGSLTLDFNDHRGIEAQIEGYYIGNNNDLNRPAYTFFNGFVTKTVSRNASFTLSANNLFDQNVSFYGYFGHQLYVPVNSLVAPTSTSIQEAVAYGNGTSFEQFGLPPRLFQATLSLKI